MGAARPDLEAGFLNLWKLLAPPGAALPEAQYRFHPVRQWRFDFAWPAARVAVEIDGGQWVQGKHQRGSRIGGDREKDRAAQLAGWIVLRYVTDDLRKNPIGLIAEVAGAVAGRPGADP